MRDIEVTIKRDFTGRNYAINIELNLRAAKFFSEGHVNITECMMEDVEKAVKLAKMENLEKEQ